MMCQVYDVSRFGYHAWKRRGESRRSIEDEILSKQVIATYDAAKGRYGSPRIYQVLKQSGVSIGRHRVARLMRENGLKARTTRVYPRHLALNQFYAGVGNKIESITATMPNTIWVGDVTYLQVNKRWRYLAVVMDKCSRRIVGWSLSEKRDANITTVAFKHAVKRRGIGKGLYFHSDRGGEYVSKRYQEFLSSLGVVQSVNRKGKMNDYAEMESFFHSLKGECLHPQIFQTDHELRQTVAQYIKFYNHKRLHSSLGYTPPAEFEMMIG